MAHRQTTASKYSDRVLSGPSYRVARPRSRISVRPGYEGPAPPKYPAQHKSHLPECQICSYRQPYTERSASVTHRHFSTTLMMKMTKDKDGKFNCSSCKQVHGPTPTERIKLCVSDSTLHMFWAPPDIANSQPKVQYEGDIQHTNYITIPGGKIETIQQAFRIEYGKETRGIDVLVVAGLNNFLKRDTKEEVMRKLDMFRNTVMKQSQYLHPSTPNTFAVATLLYAPQLAWFPDDGDLPSHNYRNHLEDIQWTNEQIIRFNKENGVPMAPHLHKYGVRRDNKTSKDRFGNISVRHTVNHRWEQWREKEAHWMLHLVDEKRIVMGQAVNKYFRFNTA